MDTTQLMLKTYFGWTSLTNPEKAARKSLKLFQKVQKKNIREREASFFEQARKFKIQSSVEEIDCFEMGNPNGQIIFLVHGWDSNAGSMSKIAQKLAEENFRIITFNLPGHAFYKSSFTNIVECKDVFLDLIQYVNPREPFSVVTHSFGSAVATYALSKTAYRVDKMVLLTNPNKIETIFKEFRSFIGLNKRAYKRLLSLSYEKLGEPLNQVCVEHSLKRINYQNLLLIHDKYDKVLSYQHSSEVSNAIENANLITLENVGHYKMLWNDEVINRTAGFVKGKEVF